MIYGIGCILEVGVDRWHTSWCSEAQVMKLAEHTDSQVRAWASDAIPELDRSIELERVRDREREESFE